MRFVSVVFAALAAFVLQPQSASAQATRTWVSGVGDDANPCSRTAPCKSFAGAISKTAANGEINVLDPGGYGAVTITKSISIIADGSTAGISVPGTNAIIVNVAANDRVVLKGLDFEGVNTGLAGVAMVGAGKLTVVDCIIRDFTTAGIDVRGTTGARVFVDRTTIVNNAVGIKVAGTGGANTLFLHSSIVDASGNSGVEIASGNTAVVSDSTLSGSGGFDLASASGSTVISYGNNVIRSGNPTQTTPLR